VDAWWWIPIGLAAWFAVSVAVGLRLGSFLRSCSQAWETLDEPTAEILDLTREPPRHWRQAS
jgi:hypothetical protein